MKMKKCKLFWKLGDSDKHIISQPFDDDEEYYSLMDIVRLSFPPRQ